MKIIRYFFILLTPILLLSGCGKNLSASFYSSTQSSSSQGALEEYVKAFYMQSYRSADSKEKIFIVDTAETKDGGYALLHYTGDGPQLILYRYAFVNGAYQINGKIDGELARSGSVNFNLFQDENKYIYFSSIGQTHWDPNAGEAVPVTYNRLVAKDSENTQTKELSGKKGFILVFDSQMQSFQFLDSIGNTVLDESLYNHQGYPINACQLIAL